MLQTESETRDNRKVNSKVYRFILYVLPQDGLGRKVYEYKTPYDDIQGSEI